MRPANRATKIFLDGGDPQETKEILNLLGFLDGQTTNPTLIAKNPEAQARLASGKKFSREQVYDFYSCVVQELSGLVPDGSISVEVYADKSTTSGEMIKEAREMFYWIPNAHIKLPLTASGLGATEQLVKDGVRVNVTLCFSQEQAAAVYAATQGAKPGQVFISPFVGRLDDRGENGMQLIANILRMYESGDGHVQVLTASVRTLEHFLYALTLKSDIITAPAKVLKEWAKAGMNVPGPDFQYSVGGLKPIPYQAIDLNKPWKQYNIFHELTDVGIERFAADWNSLLA